MKINAIMYTPMFRAANTNEQQIPMETEFLRILRSGQAISSAAIDEKTGDTMFHLFVKNNYTRLLSYMIARGYDFKDVINRRSANGTFPLDEASSPEMKIMLQRIGGISIKDAPDAAPAQTQPAEDAKVIAAKQYMTEPVMNKIEEKITDVVPKVETQPAETNFFDSFEEVTEDSETNLPAVQNADEEVQTVSSPEKQYPKELNTEGLKDFKMLEITEKDVLSVDDLIGQTDVKSELKQNLVMPLKDKNISEKLKANQIDLPNGLLLVGNGSALTTVKALSNDAEIPVVIIENPQELPQIMTAVEARFKKTSLRTAILAQGFDKWWSQCKTCNDPKSNTFKNNLKGIKDKGGLFIGTTTDKQFVCSDFIQSGIIDKVLELTKPSKDDRFLFLYKYLNDKKIFENILNEENTTKIVNLTEGLYFADIKRILDETARTAMVENKPASMEIFEEQLKDFSKETDRVPITEENRTAAYDTPNFQRIPVVEGEIMSLDELGGMPETKQKLRNLYVEPMKNLDELSKVFGNDAIPDGAIFYGAPGNGKTLTARVLARELGLPYYETRLSDFGTALVHESGKAFKKLADQLDKKFKETGERSVWFLDEFDGIGASRSGNGQGDRELTDALLQELTNPQERGFILIAATNNLEDVDSALRRRGRLGNWIEFKNPNQAEREDTIRKNLLKHEFTKEFADDQTFISHIAAELDGFSMSSIANILKDAKRDYYINKTDFEQAIEKALDENAKREMGEFCGKAGLSPHTYSENAFQSLDELGGMDGVKKELEENVVNVWKPEVIKIFKENKMDLPGGVILEGPPGTGKTTIIETLAREMDVPLFKMDYSKMSDSSYIHSISRHVAEIFEKLKLQSKILKKPVMLFFDEAEKFFPRSAREKHDIEEVNTYKELMNTSSENGIILVGATNHIDKVNQEIIGNPRRMGTIIHVDNPDDEARKSLFEKMRDTKPIFDGVLTAGLIGELVYLTRGLSIGDITDKMKKLFTQAALKKQKIDEQVILKAFRKMAV